LIGERNEEEKVLDEKKKDRGWVGDYYYDRSIIFVQSFCSLLGFYVGIFQPTQSSS
jgi:hypothetical protein